MSYCHQLYLIPVSECVERSFGFKPQSGSSIRCVHFQHMEVFVGLQMFHKIRMVHSGKHRQDRGFSFWGYFAFLPCGWVSTGSLSGIIFISLFRLRFFRRFSGVALQLKGRSVRLAAV